MLPFVELRVRGFKSFLEPVSIPLERGLTGVIGPNGCGKSNVLEAIRWVMGASSAKALRGDAMEDVIFSGTDRRPARDIASVTLVLDNTGRTAPHPFTDDDRLELTREIRRHRGSVYRVNGREVRARDVRLLLADTATGANSPALVRQGQISALVSAKPQNRRLILEEAAGVAGLRQRRHDAQLKLDQASRDLDRIEDMLADDERQLRSLERQARMARKYREVKAQLDDLARWAAWRAVSRRQQQLRDSSEALNAARATSDTAERAAIEARTLLQRTEAAAAPLAEQRQNLAVEKAVAERAVEEAARSLANWQRAREQAAEARRQQASALAEAARLREDHVRDKQAATAALEAAEAQMRTLADIDLLERELAAAREAAQTTRDAARDAARHEAELRAEQQSRDATRARAEQRLARAAAMVARAQEDTAALSDAATPAEEDHDIAALTIALAETETQLAECTAALDTARTLARTSREEADAADAAATRLASQIEARGAALDLLLSDTHDPAVDAVRCREEDRDALAAALGAAAFASLDPAAPFYWQSMVADPSLPALPSGVTPLITRIDAPSVLRAFLSQVGLVDSDQLDRLAPALAPGQMLVTREGALRRWDGLSGAPGHAGDKARQVQAARTELEHLRDSEEAVRKGAEAARTRADDAAAALEHAVTKERRAADERREAAARLQLAEGEMAARQREAERRIAHGEQVRALLARAEEEHRDAKAALDALPTNREDAFAEARDAARSCEDAARQAQNALEKAETAWRDAQAAQRHAQQERDSARHRLELATERVSTAQARIVDLEAQSAKQGPVFSEEEEQTLLGALEDARSAGDAAVTAFRAGDDAMAQSAKSLEAARKAAAEADRAFADAQRRVASLDAQVAAQTEALEEAGEQVRQSTGFTVRRLAEWAEGREPPEGDLEAALNRARTALEKIGPVNMAADAQAQEIRQKLDTVQRERADVADAVAELRGTISQINGRARKRLEEAFGEINRHYATLFSTLFDGGEAFLSLVEADDPLEAGLEVHAQPPGKQVSTLSLLSGGEQALTAIALIFAVFLARPAPLCTLDEVDAPLDDANVDRFCRLLEAMVERTGTPFVVITHNPVTMARMDRLIGVTMAERGVSSIVSVQLAEAERFVEA